MLRSRSRSRSRLRAASARVAAALGALYAAVAGCAILPAAARRGELLGADRIDTLVPPLVFWAVAIALSGRNAARRGAWLALAFAAAWICWGVLARMSGLQDSFATCVHAAAHEKVWFQATALAALAWLHAGREQQPPSRT